MSIPQSDGTQFFETRNIYAEYIGYKNKLDYEDWMKLPDDHKAAALYVRFFHPIIEAWKQVRYLVTAEDSIDILCQYLLKNVEKIKADPKRYSDDYIHTVAYNCMYTINHCRKIDRERAYCEIYEYDARKLLYGNTENDKLDDTEFSGYEDTRFADVLDDVNRDRVNQQLWDSIEELGEDALKVAEGLADGKKLRGIRGVHKEDKKKAIEKLKPVLKNYQEAVG